MELELYFHFEWTFPQRQRLDDDSNPPGNQPIITSSCYGFIFEVKNDGRWTDYANIRVLCLNRKIHLNP